MFNFEKNKLLIFSKAIIFIALFFCFNKDVLASDNSIMDGFPFVVDNNFSSFNGLTDGFNAFFLKSDNPFSDPYDRSLQAGNNQGNSPDQISSNIGPIPGNGFSVSWWFKWAGYSGSLSLDVKDASGHILLGAYLGKNANNIHTPYGSNNINWDYYNLTESQMGDGNWHQFILTSNGSDIELYFDGQQVASGIYENPINYTGREIKYIRLGGSGIKRFDEIIFWDKYITLGDANSIYFYGSFADKIEKEELVDIEPGKISNVIMDGFPFNADNNFDSFNGLTDGFNTLSLKSDNPFSDPYDRSLLAVNNQVNSPDQISSNIGPIPGNGFSVSWWFKWVSYSGSLSLDVKDASAHILLGSYLGKNANQVYAPHGTEGIFWSDYNLTESQMGDGNWHQFILTSNGVDIDLYFNGQQVATGTYNNIVDYKDREIKNIRIAGFGTKRFDEIVLWNKYLTSNDANLIYSLDSLVDEYEKNSRTIDIAVILAEPKDVRHLSSPVTAQPCKLIPEKIYQNGHDMEYYEDLLYCVKDYHCENSFGERNEQDECQNGLVNLEFKIHDNGGQWYVTEKNIDEYRTVPGGPRKEKKFIDDVLENVSGEEHDVYIVVGTGDSKQLGGYFNTMAFRDGTSMISETDGVYFLAHEIMHFLGLIYSPEDNRTMTPDLYEMGETQSWDIMHKANSETKDNPMLSNSYIKEFLQWFKYDIYARNDFGEYWIGYLEDKKYDDNIFRYNLEDSNNEDVEEYYIIEARDKDIKIWDSSVLRDDVVVLYYVDENGTDEYGYSEDWVILNELRTVSVPGQKGGKISFLNKGVLSPVFNETFRDFDKLIKITAKNKEEINGKEGINVKIEDMTEKSWSDKFWGFVLDDKTKIARNISYASFNTAGYTTDAELNEDAKKQAVSMIPLALIILFLSSVFITIYIVLIRKFGKFRENKLKIKIAKIITMIPSIILSSLFLLLLVWIIGLSISYKTNKYFGNTYLFAPPMGDTILPDSDLHLYCDDGKHVGMNYETGEYEMDIPETETIGDGFGSREWIFIPREYKDECHFVVSSYDTQKFIEENPDVVLEIGLENINNEYDIYAREIDPESGIFTSNIITEIIDPGEMVEYIASGTDDILISSSTIFDITPPRIIPLLPFDGQEILHNEIIEIEYIVEDNYSGVATNTIEIRLDDNILFSTTIDLFNYNLGNHIFTISAEDKVGNSTTTEINFQIMANTTSTISDINRAYSEGMIIKEEVRDNSIKRLESIQKYIEKYGQREEKGKKRQEEMMNKCIARRGEEWCQKHLEKLFEKTNYRLSEIHKKIVILRYKILLKELELYKKKNWVNEQGHGIIREDIEYLINKIKNFLPTKN